MRHDTRARQRRRATLAGAVAAGALILAGCAPAEQTPTLTWYTNPDDGGQAKIAAQCTDAANGRYRIETSMLPTDAASQREQLTRRLAAGDTSMDIMSLDPPFVPELAEPGFLAPVPEEMQAYAKDNALEAPSRPPAGRTSSSRSRSGPTRSCSGTASRSPRPRGWTCPSPSRGTS